MANLDKIKERSIVDYLESRGFKSDKTIGNNMFFALDGEKTGSTAVDIKKNIFHCFNADKGGSIIDLVILLDGCDFKAAVKELSKNDIKVIKRVAKIEKPIEKEKGVSIRVLSLKDKDDAYKIKQLIDYAAGRGISKNSLNISGVKPYLFEKKELDTKEYFLGLKNEQGGLSLRSSIMKRNHGHMDISIIDNGYDKDTVIEGMFDYFSLVEIGVKSNFIVLNSVVNAKKCGDELLKRGKEVDLVLNGDNPGKIATDKIKSICSKANIIFLPTGKDLNNLLIEKKIVNYFPIEKKSKIRFKRTTINN